MVAVERPTPAAFPLFIAKYATDGKRAHYNSAIDRCSGVLRTYALRLGTGNTWQFAKCAHLTQFIGDMRMTAHEVRSPQFQVCMVPFEVRAPHPSGTQFIGRVRMTADGERAPQFRVRMTAREVRAPHPSGTQFIGRARMTTPGVRAPQFQVRMAPFEVRAPQCQAHNSLRACA